MQKSNSVAEVEYIDKSENASPTDGTEQQRRKSDQELDLTAPPQAVGTPPSENTWHASYSDT